MLSLFFVFVILGLRRIWLFER